MNENIYIKEIKYLTKEDFIKKYPNPFLVSFDDMEANNEMQFSTTTIDIKKILESKNNPRSLKECLNIIQKKGNIDNKVFVGRAPSIDLVIKDTSISKLHAYFFFFDDKWHLIDRNSKNGTFLNNIKLDSLEKVLLKNGNIIRFSQFSFYFYSSENTYDVLKGQI